MTDEEQAAAVQADNQEEKQPAEAAAVQADSQEEKQPAEAAAPQSDGGNFGEDAADNFGESAGNGYEDNFGLGEASQAAGTIPAPPPPPKKKEPAPPVTPRNREEDSDDSGEDQQLTREEDLFQRFQLMRVPQKVCEYAELFRPYLFQNPDAPKKLDELLCDDASRETVRIGLRRLEAFPPPEFRSVIYFSPIGMTTESEREDWQAHLRNYPEYAKITNGEYPYYDPPQFFYRNGAVFLDSAVTDRLAGGLFYQCGAFCGASLIAMNQYKPEKMIGFEPLLGHMRFVQANIAHAGLKNLELYKMFLAEREGRVSLADRDEEGNPCRTESLMVRLDFFEEKKNVQGRVAWIQADVNGYGLQLIRGAEKIIKREKPLITIGVYHNPDEFFGIAPLLHEWVPEYKFMMRRCQCNVAVPYSEITLIAYIP